ncbi:MAG: hemerythrin family protein [Candidatus Hydrogenedentes bacterium]|nr:hemerythrin family protein [Candidatus Hydrogenedentota bacterium]
MSILVWDEKYSVGISEIDRQHQRLIQMINDLHEALVAERGQQALTEIVGRMLDYTIYHFAAEETLLKNNGYALYDAHQQEHAGFGLSFPESRRIGC